MKADNTQFKMLNSATLPVVTIEGVPFVALKIREVAKWIIERHTQGYGGWVVTPNIDILRRLLLDQSFYALVSSETTIFTADGTPIIWISRLLGTPLPERVAGSDLFIELVSEAASHGKSIYLLGGNPGVAETTAAILQSKFPKLCVAGFYAPPFGFEHSSEEMENIRQKIIASRPDIIFVGLGSPKQEVLIASLRELLPYSWWLGIGVSFSFVAGEVKRAPVWTRRIGFEWLYRVIQEPKRLFKRYFIVGIPFTFMLFMRIIINRLTRRS